MAICPLHRLVLMVMTWAPGSVGAGAGLYDGTGPSFLKIYTLRRRFQRLDTLGNVWAPKALHWHLEVSGGSQKVENKTGDRVETSNPRPGLVVYIWNPSTGGKET